MTTPSTNLATVAAALGVTVDQAADAVVAAVAAGLLRVVSTTETEVVLEAVIPADDVPAATDEHDDTYPQLTQENR